MGRNLQMNLAHQRAGRVNRAQAPAMRLIDDLGRHPMRAENGQRTARYRVQALYEQRAVGLKISQYLLVVYDLMQYVHRRTVYLQGELDDIDGTNHAGAETSGPGQYRLLGHMSFRVVQRRKCCVTPYTSARNATI